MLEGILRLFFPMWLVHSPATTLGLKDLITTEDWLINNSMSQAIKYFLHVKGCSGLKWIVMESLSPPQKSWRQTVYEEGHKNFEDILGMKAPETRTLAGGNGSFRKTLMGAVFHRAPATWWWRWFSWRHQYWARRFTKNQYYATLRYNMI